MPMDQTNQPRIRVLFDGDCPFCRNQADFLQRHDRHGNLRLINMRTIDLAKEQIPVPAAELEKQLHVITPDGSVMRGMDAVRVSWTAIGRGWLIRPTGWPLLCPLFDALYRFIAKNRKRLMNRRFGSIEK